MDFFHVAILAQPNATPREHFLSLLFFSSLTGNLSLAQFASDEEAVKVAGKWQSRGTPSENLAQKGRLRPANFKLRTMFSCWFLERHSVVRKKL